MSRKERIERPSLPLPSNDVERGGFRRRALCALTMLALAEIGSAHAACAPAGTSHGDTIVCSGSQSEGVTAKSGNDSISILSGASISLTGAQSATAIDAGSGNDSVVNDGRVSVTVSPAPAAPAGKSTSCSASGGDSSGKSPVQGVGIAGGGGNDLVNNRGTVAVQTSAAGGTQAPQCESSSSGHDDNGGHPPVKPAALSIGILGDKGNDQISNSGSLTVGASSDGGSPQATAKGIAGGNGNDLIVNTGTITVAASATVAPATVAPASQTEASLSASSKGSQSSKPQDISETASATAVGIEGGNDKDNIDNAGTLNASASAGMKSVAPVLTLTGGDNVVATTTVETRAVGIDAGSGKDRISNSGTITANATSKIDDVSVSLNLIDLSKADTSTFIRSSATGIDAGSGSDDITIANGGSIAANATSTSSSVAVNVSAIDASTADTKLQIQSTAVGVAGGYGRNAIDSGGTISASAASQLSAVDVGVNFVDATIARPPADSSTTLDATATGIDGRKGANDINVAASGSVSATAASTAHSTGVGVGFLGISNDVVTLAENGGIADVGITSNSSATGIAGGSQRDYVSNLGGVTSTATSTATQTEVSVGIGLVDVLIPIPDLGLVGAGTKADARASGIDAGAGDDVIFNSGLVRSDATANASTTAVTFSLSVFSVGPQLLPVSAGLTAADVATTASAETVGIAGGSGDDAIHNTGQVQTQATANGGAVGVAATVNIEYEKGESSFGLDVTAARAATDATARAVGIDGGSGRNELQNDGGVTARADANATAVGVAVGVAGNLRGAAGLVGGVATDTSSTAIADATGVRGGADDDRILNSGNIAASANAGVTSVSASVGVSIAKQGLVADIGLARAQSNASATATGIDGGGGNDEIENTGTVGATAKANADAVAASVTVEGTKQGVAGGAALTDTTTTATATATGIRGGGAPGDDRGRDDKDWSAKHDDGKNGRIGNAGTVNADAQAQALSVSASVNVAIAKEGLALGGALARAESNATGTAIGIDGAGGNGEIENTGSIAATAKATADAVGVSVAVAGTKQGVAGGAALTDTSTTATATATGIRGGAAAEDKDGHDSKDGGGSNKHENINGSGSDKHDDGKSGSITNTNAISVEAQANALSVSASANVSIAKEGVALGAALADTSTHAAAVAKGIEAGSAGDEINNDGNIAVKAGASGQAVSVALTVEGTATGLAAGAALVDASVHSASTGIGVDGGAGDDRITNRGAISIDKAQSNATAVGVAASVLVAKQGAALGAALADTSATAVSVASGIDGASGNDALTNLGAITAQNISAGATAVAVSLDVALSSQGLGAGAALANSASSASAAATGIDGGSGNDELLNQGGIALQGAKADADAVSVSLAIAGAQEGLALSAALVDATATATAGATGIAGGAGNDKLSNFGTIVANDIRADANAVGVSVSASFSQTGAVAAAALAKTGTTAGATAKGLDGGEGDDSLYNAGSVTLQQAKADAGAVSVSVGLSGAEAGVTIAAGLADASGKAFATAMGLDGGTGDDSLFNDGNGKIAVEDTGASAHAAGISVALSGSSVGLSAGAALADTSGTATTTAKGLDGGDGKDALLNDGQIALSRTTADADSTSVGVSISASLSAGVAAGAALSRAGATANATATGMDGGAGKDWILNRGSITVDGVSSSATSTGVSVQLGVASAGVAIGAALADTRSNATATAKGLDGGEGDDWLKNQGQITLQNVKSDARATSVGVTMNAAIEAGVAAGVALTDARSTADVAATGMDGGAGNDALYNVGSIKIQDAEADAHATGVSVTVNVSLAGIAAGAALADTSATARTVVKGMDGGAGDDFIQNTGTIDVQGKAKTDATSVAINVSGSVGVAGGAEITHASTTATATVIGIDGASGRDEVGNEGGITAKAEAESKAAAISVGISVGVGGDATLADAKSDATATAIGINMGDASATGGGTLRTQTNVDHDSGDDHKNSTNVIQNSGALTVTATSTSTGTSISGNLLGFALGDTTNTSTAGAVGIRTGDTKDQVENTGAINATGSATATGLSVSVTLGGKAMGDASTTAQATATGIETRGGDDEIENRAAIQVRSTSQASADTVSVGLIGSARADASTTSLATATGIDGGSGKDTIVNRASVTASAGDAAASAAADCTAAGGACANSSSVSVNLGGTGAVDATTAARSAATGIAGGADDDSIYSDGAIDASARAKTGANGVNISIFGSTQTAIDTAATASATGVGGGDGNDVIETHSTIKAASASHIAISGTGFNLGGSGGFDATLSATALATAIDGGAGKDTIHNEAALTVSATATLSSSGGSNVVFGSSGAGATSGAFTDAAGIRAGAGDDQVWNGGAIDVRSGASLSLSSSSFTFGGTTGTNGSLTASTLSSGIAGGSGRDSITNEGELYVSSSSTLASSGGSNVAFGTSGAGANSGAATTALGIDGGDDDDVIVNKGRVTAGSSASLSLDGSSFSFGGTGGTSGSLAAATQSTGIAGGTGRDSITNEGELSVSATSTQVSSGGSNVAFGTSGAGANSGAVTTAVGIDGGDDDDVIVNRGRVTAGSSASLSMDNSSFTFGGTGGTSGSLTASTRSTGIAGGTGRDSITNESEVNANASSTLVSSGDSSVAFGSSGAGSDSGAVTGAVGIDGGDGDDVILNKGRVTASSDATLRMDNSSFSFGGGGGTSGRLAATTRSVGIQGGAGNDAIQNDGDIVVRANSNLQNSGHVSNDLGGGTSASGEVVATLSARGIDGGAGDNWIVNNGTIDVKGAVSATSTHSSSSGFFFGGGTSVAQARADITAIGIDAGQGNSTVLNANSIAVELSGALSTQTSADGSSLGFDGDANGFSKSVLSATAIGITAGDGANQITNTGSIDVKTWRPFEFLGIVLPLPVQAGAGGHAEGHGFRSATEVTGAETSVFAAGISAGNGANAIRNEGSIDVDLRANAIASASSDAGGSGIGDGESHADSAISATAIGIAAGDGANQITNTGSIRVGTSLFASGDSSAVGHLTGDADAFSSATVNAFAAGISTGNGANTIRNEGSIDVALGATATSSAHPDAGSTGDNTAGVAARITAQGYGIRAGSGNNTVVNTGTINVTVTASNNTGSGHITASATGIETGAGNDTITNAGTITATTVVNGVSSPGTAIRAGAGDDTVTLTAGSVTNGSIDLGTGNNRLMVQGTPVINGTILDGSGSLALTFNATGSLSTALPGWSATKTGAGTFTLSMLNKMQRLEVDQGTLKLDNDYAFMSGGTFQARINGNGSYGQFYVTGQAALDGTMKIVRGGGAYVNGTAFDVLTASNGIQPGTAFSRVELPEDTRLLKFHTEQLSDGVRVKADVASFTTVAGTPNQMAVAGTLDRILPKTTGALNQLLGKIQTLPEAQFASAFASMSPAVYAGYTASTFNSMQQYTNVLQDRMTALRAQDFSPVQSAGAWGREPIRLAYNGTGLSNLLEASDAERARSSGLWLRGFSQKGDQNPTESMNGYDYRMAGTSVGYDGRFTKTFSAGVSLGTARNTVTVDNNVSQGDVDTTMGSVYAGYFDRSLYLNGTLSAGRNKYDTRRTNAVDQSTSSSSHDGKVLATTVGVGSYVQAAAWWIEPFATVQYTRLKEDGFSETGGSANQVVEGRSTSGLVSTLGGRFSRPTEDGNGALWVPQASLAWLHDYSKNQVINASYVGVPDSSFSVDGQPVQRNGALVGLGLSYRSKGGYITTFQYTGEFRDGFRAHGLAGEFRYEF
ncbi:MAG TPA: hypothetical protein VLV56_02050 [Burkholderiales bacterium]|nr:hypothetical protein [Burkholderiales bacterium]